MEDALDLSLLTRCKKLQILALEVRSEAGVVKTQDALVALLPHFKHLKQVHARNARNETALFSRAIDSMQPEYFDALLSCETLQEVRGRLQMVEKKSGDQFIFDPDGGRRPNFSEMTIRGELPFARYICDNMTFSGSLELCVEGEQDVFIPLFPIAMPVVARSVPGGPPTELDPYKSCTVSDLLGRVSAFDSLWHLCIELNPPFSTQFQATPDFLMPLTRLKGLEQLTIRVNGIPFRDHLPKAGVGKDGVGALWTDTAIDAFFGAFPSMRHFALEVKVHFPPATLIRLAKAARNLKSVCILTKLSIDTLKRLAATECLFPKVQDLVFVGMEYPPGSR